MYFVTIGRFYDYIPLPLRFRQAKYNMKYVNATNNLPSSKQAQLYTLQQLVPVNNNNDFCPYFNMQIMLGLYTSAIA